MPSFVISVVLAPIVVVVATIALFLIYLAVRYTRHIVRVFEEKPLFLPLQVAPLLEGEEAEFRTKDKITLQGTYLKCRTTRRTGVIVFCHEYLSDRWSVVPYADGLRDLGFDLFTFDFRNHGQSQVDDSYRPLQWVTNHEVHDIRAAMRYVRSRPDADPAGVGLFGISRGGGGALCVAGEDPRVWGIVTDGAFPTKGMMLSYMRRWADIYTGGRKIYKSLPTWVFSWVGFVARVRSQYRLHCIFPNIEGAVAKIGPRPWFMIHGERDTYISTEIARTLFAEAREPKELWVVPQAKHNRGRELQPTEYAAKLALFFERWAPRSLNFVEESPSSVMEPTQTTDLSLVDLVASR